MDIFILFVWVYLISISQTFQNNNNNNISENYYNINNNNNNNNNKCPVNSRFTSAGIALHKSGHSGAALSCLLLAYRQNKSAVTLNNLAAVQLANQMWEEAEISLKKAQKHDPNYRKTFQYLISVYYEQRRIPEALLVAKEWQKLYPDELDSNLYLASMCYESNLKLESLYFYKIALNISPNQIAALVNTAVIYNDLGDYSSSEKYSLLAINLDAHSFEARISLSSSLISTQQFVSAVKHLNAAISLRPNDKQAICKLIGSRRHLCDWSDYNNDVIKLKQILELEYEKRFEIISENSQICHSPGNLLFFPLPVELIRNTAFISLQKISQSLTKTRRHNLTSYKDFSRYQPLRIGFVSFDFKNHPASHIMYPLLKELAKFANLQIFAYSLSDYRDEWTNRIKYVVHTFRDFSDLNLNDIIEFIIHDQINILIDLMGFTSGSRLEIFASKPSPLQISYLGFPGSMGDYRIYDYTICDQIACDSTNVENEFAEKVIFLPPPYFISPVYEEKLPVLTKFELLRSKQHFNLPDDKFIFCCLSKLSKIDPKTFQIWTKILKKAENSILWLIDSPKESSNFIQKEARKNKIGKQIVMTSSIKKPLYFQMVPEICDLFLDTFEYTGHTVSAEMLSRGLPILTLKGAKMSSRVTSSFLYSLNLTNHLIANTTDQYLAKAVNIYNNNNNNNNDNNNNDDDDDDDDNDVKNALRKKLDRGLVSPVRLARLFHNALTTVWNRYSTGLQPQHLYVHV